MSLIDKIEKYRNFKSWYNLGVGITPKERIINTAIKIAKYVDNSPLQGEPFLGLSGEINIAFCYKDYYLDIIVDHTEKIIYSLEKDNKEIDYIENLTLKDTLKKLRDLLKISMIDHIKKLMNLKKDWDSYGSDPPNEISYNNSLIIIDALVKLDLIPTNISPSVEGGICFSFINNRKHSDIECDNEGDIIVGTSAIIESEIIKQDVDIWEIDKYNTSELEASINKIKELII